MYHPILRFVCQFNIEGNVTSVNAELLDDTIHCDEVEFTYDSETPTFHICRMHPFAQKHYCHNLGTSNRLV